MTKIFVSGASGIVGYGIIRSLRMADSTLKILGSSNKDFSPANVFSDRFFLAPTTSSREYLGWLQQFLQTEKPDIAIPGIEADLALWNQNRDVFLRSGTKPLLNDCQLIVLCQDKWAFFQELRRLGEETIIETMLADDFDEIVSRFGIPFILKPRRGYGGQGFSVISNRTEFLENFKPDQIAQPYVGERSKEYTVSAYGDGRGGFPHIFAMRRELDPSGFTSFAEIVDPQPFLEPIHRIGSNFRALGPTNFQFREGNGKLFLLEINPRISSSSSIRSGFGFNETAIGIRHLLTGIIETPQPEMSGSAMRYVEDFFVRLKNQPRAMN